MKNIMVTLAMFFVSVATAGVITVSDPGQAQGKLITTRDIVPFVKVTLTASNAPDQSVYLTIKQSGAGSDIDLFTGSASNKLTGMQTVLGPFVVKSGQTNHITISARVNGVKATNASPISLNLTTVSNTAPVSVQGTLPVQGTSYVVNTNSEDVIHGKFTSMKVISGIPYLFGISYPFRLYEVQYSTNMVNWITLFGKCSSGANGELQIQIVMDIYPPKGCFFRLNSAPQ